MPYYIQRKKFKLYSVKEFSKLLNTREKNIYKLIHNDKIKIIYIHNLLLITPWEVDKFIYQIYPEQFCHEPSKEDYLDLIRRYGYMSRQAVKAILGVGSSFSHFFVPNELPQTIIRNEICIKSDDFYQHLVNHEHYYSEDKQ